MRAIRFCGARAPHRGCPFIARELRSGAGLAPKSKRKAEGGEVHSSAQLRKGLTVVAA
jgi:hypothetical protein